METTDDTGTLEVEGARTQSLFRDVNERVSEINEAFSIALPLGDWVCECAKTDCSERVMLTHEDYARIRADPKLFFVAASEDHVFEDIEDVVERHEGYWVVRKNGLAGELAARADQRPTD
jgi:hypothetical protein